MARFCSTARACGKRMPDWFDPQHWGSHARPVDSGRARRRRGSSMGRSARAVLRHYLRGGWAPHVSRDRHLWRGADRMRSFAEFRLLRALLPSASCRCRGRSPRSTVRDGHRYRAAILLERLDDVRSLADRAAVAGDGAPWEEAGRLIARFHRAGLDHADLNAHNLLFDDAGNGWMIDLDRGAMRIPATRWRERNLARLKRSLLKLRGERSVERGRSATSRACAPPTTAPGTRGY